MGYEADKLFHDLKRYRYLLGRVIDCRFGEVLKELIGETEARLDAIDQKAAGEVKKFKARLAVNAPHKQVRQI